jgi:hypothetical protein
MQLSTAIKIGQIPICYFTNSASKILQDINKWFTTNLLQNADKTQHRQFVIKTSSLIEFHVTYNNKEVANTSNKKFLG